MTNYPETVAAGVAVGQDKKALAEALYREIPPRRPGRTPAGTPTVEDALAEAAADLLAEGGESYSVVTLRNYRDVATWAAGNSTGPGGVSWANASWTAHLEAWGKGEPFAQFAADPATKRRVRERNGGRTGDVPAAARAINTQPAEADALVEALSPEGRRDVAVALLADEDTRAAVEDATGMVVEPLSHTLERVAEAEARQHHAAQTRDPHAVRLARVKGAVEAHLADYPEDAQPLADWTATKAMEVQEARR